MQVPPSTTDNSTLWRIWHGCNYIVGGITFFIGSIILFPMFYQFIDVANISGYLYSIGSFTFLLADITELMHYLDRRCSFPILSINFLMSAIGSLLYLIGSIDFIPAMNAAEMGEFYFQVGSSFIFISQGWKIFRTLKQPDKTVKECYEEDVCGFYVDLFAGLGGAMYLIGTFLLVKSAEIQSLAVPSVIMYSIGGTFFLSSGIFMLKRYFFRDEHLSHYQFTDDKSSQEV